MGALCCKSSGSGPLSKEDTDKGTLRVMFERLDKEKKGYISEKNLQDLMRDDKTFFQGTDVNHILQKFGKDGKLTFVQFKSWWGSTYTTYGDDANLGRLVDEVNAEQRQQQQGHLDTVREDDDKEEVELPSAPHNSNVAISRS